MWLRTLQWWLTLCRWIIKLWFLSLSLGYLLVSLQSQSFSSPLPFSSCLHPSIYYVFWPFFPSISLPLILSPSTHLVLVSRTELPWAGVFPAGARDKCGHSGQPRGGHSRSLLDLWALPVCEYPKAVASAFKTKASPSCSWSLPIFCLFWPR